MAKIDESRLPLDLQTIILTGMTFDELCNYVAVNICNGYEKEEVK